MPTTDFRSYKQKEKKNIINNLKQINFKNKLISREATFTKDKIKTLIVLQILKIIEVDNHLLPQPPPKTPDCESFTVKFYHAFKELLIPILKTTTRMKQENIL